jgi:serine/threonine protein kinase
MNTWALTDSVIKLKQPPEKCPQCSSISSVGRGLCVSCLLRLALDSAEPELDSLDEVFSEVEVRDTDWRLGNYQILEEIGRGGMGVIYRARQKHSQRIVALKRVLGYHGDSRETLIRFRREAEAAARLDHPNVLPIYEVGVNDGLPFFSMKYATGGSLLGLKATLRDDPRRVVMLVTKIARAVAYAHDNGVVHRDLKPGNILLDSRGEPLVSDFGLAKWLEVDSDVTRTLTVFGTPGFIAPEQASGRQQNLTLAADIYSLGAILFDLFTGRPPFLGTHALAVIKQAEEKPAPKLRTILPKLDRDLETICARCLEREPSARYQTAAELADDLERWSENRPIRARPVSPPVVLWRWVCRNPAMAAVGGVCALLSATVLWLEWLQWEGSSTRSLRSENSRRTPTTKTSVPDKSVAVLPFENVSREKADELFIEGMQEDVRKDLARIADLKVISSESIRTYNPDLPRDLAAIAHALGVKYLVEGEGRREQNRIRVNVQLIDATTGARRWAEHYDRDLKDFFTIKGEVAQAIAHHLNAHITSLENAEIKRRPTADLEAYDLYLRARQKIESAVLTADIGQIFSESAELFKEAIARDPGFFEAYCELVRAHGWVYLVGFDHTARRLTEMEEAAAKVAVMRPNSGEAHYALAQKHYYGHLDYDAARRELVLAEEALPNNSDVFALRGYVDRRQGHWENSTRALRRALDLNPRHFQIQQEAALTFYLQRRFSEMAAVIDRALAIMPQHAATRITHALISYARLGDTRPLHDTIAAIMAADKTAGPHLAQYWFWMGLFERDLMTLEQAIAVMPAEGMAADTARFPRAWCEAVAAKWKGDVSTAHNKLVQARQEVAQNIRQQPDFPVMRSVLGVIDANLGRKDLAIDEGKQAVALLPLSKDSLNGFNAIKYLAIIYAWTGETDLAFEQLRVAASIPSDVNYGNLLLDPAWDPLRGDPRFEKILASLAPKQN